MNSSTWLAQSAKDWIASGPEQARAVGEQVDRHLRHGDAEVGPEGEGDGAGRSGGHGVQSNRPEAGGSSQETKIRFQSISL